MRLSAMKKIRDLEGLGPKSESLLAGVGVDTVDAFLEQDPFVLYQQLKANSTISLNMLYALIGAQEGRAWQDVCRDRKTEILMRLDDMGLAP